MGKLFQIFKQGGAALFAAASTLTLFPTLSDPFEELRHDRKSISDRVEENMFAYRNALGVYFVDAMDKEINGEKTKNGR